MASEKTISFRIDTEIAKCLELLVSPGNKKVSDAIRDALKFKASEVNPLAADYLIRAIDPPKSLLALLEQFVKGASAFTVADFYFLSMLVARRDPQEVEITPESYRRLFIILGGLYDFLSGRGVELLDHEYIIELPRLFAHNESFSDVVDYNIAEHADKGVRRFAVKHIYRCFAGFWRVARRNNIAVPGNLFLPGLDAMVSVACACVFDGSHFDVEGTLSGVLAPHKKNIRIGDLSLDILQTDRSLTGCLHFYLGESSISVPLVAADLFRLVRYDRNPYQCDESVDYIELRTGARVYLAVGQLEFLRAELGALFSAHKASYWLMSLLSGAAEEVREFVRPN